MSDIETVNSLTNEFTKLNAANVIDNEPANNVIASSNNNDSIGNSLDASPSSSANSDSASMTSSSHHAANIIEASVANLINDNDNNLSGSEEQEQSNNNKDIDDDDEQAQENNEEDDESSKNNVIETNVANIIEDSLNEELSVEQSTTEKSIIGSNNTQKEQDMNSYDAVFPSLPSTGTNFTSNDLWNNVDSKASRRHLLNTTQVFHVPVEERRGGSGFGSDTNKKCEDIAKKQGVKVEICCSKDQSLHIVLSGPEERVIEAKRLIVNEIQTERDHKMRVPKEQHKFLIGKAGVVLKEIQEKTCTTIQIPKSDSQSDQITITGPKDGIEQAIHEIQIICDEQSKTGFERLNIPKLYHPWIRGFNNEIANDIMARTGAKINIPPAQIEKDEIAVSGEREKVDAACAEIKRIFSEKSKVTKLAIQITKSQHKLIIGKNGSTVQEIFKDYDVYVQVPKLESPSETIYLYGEDSKLGAALSVVCAKANSVVNVKMNVASWLHRYLIGEKGANISKITADFPGTHVEFEADNKITLDGPPDEVQKVKERIELIVASLNKSMCCVEVTCDPRHYPQLCGKKYENINKLNKEHGVVIRVPSQQDSNSNGQSGSTANSGSALSNVIRIEGAPDAVAKCKVELEELIKKVENERSKDIIIEQKYHSKLIGKEGKHLNEIRAKFNDIQIQIPSLEEKSEVITIRGNKLEVEKCYKYLQQCVKEMQENNYTDELHIYEKLHSMLIGKEGQFIRKIRDETQTRIDVPPKDSGSDSIVIVGKQENVLKARRLIEDKVKELLKIEEDHVEIPHQLHTALIGRGGAIIKQLRKDCGGVIINFPAETTTSENGSDKITLKGPREDIEKAKRELLKLAKQKNELTYSEDVPAKLDYHRFLVGKNGSNINMLREKYNVRIIFPTSSSATNNGLSVASGKDNNNNKPQDVITIIGKEENVKAVRAEIEQTLKNLDEQVTEEVDVDQKWHKLFTAKRARLINKISEDNCNVKISFPKPANATTNGATVTSNLVQIKGPRDAVKSAKKQILEQIYEFENTVQIELHVPQKYHVNLIGKKGTQSMQVSDEFKVELQFPAKQLNNETPATTNGEVDQHQDVIVISGLKENCEKAKEALLALVPISQEYPFPQKFHKNLLENKAETLKDLSTKFYVQINLPKKAESSTSTATDYLTIVGTKENIDLACKALADKLNELELNNFSVEISDIKSELIPQLRGRGGIEATRLEKKFQVRIDFSRKGEPDKILIKGPQDKVLECQAFIKKKIADEEAKTSQEISIDNRVHSRLIGQKGKAIAKIMDKFKVDIKFSGRQSDLVIVKGASSEAVDDACDFLKNLEEEYLQDVIDKEAYTHPSSKSDGGDYKTNGHSNGFIVTGAPWEQQQDGNKSGGKQQQTNLRNEPAPDTANMDLFPTIITAAVNGDSASVQKASWGPSRK